MILDAQNTFSGLALGDSPTAVGDTASSNAIDQMVLGLSFSPPGGGAYVAPFLIIRATTAFATAAGGTIQVVLQDSPDNVTYTDRIVSRVFTAAAASLNKELLAIRILPSHARYLRVAYRIATGVMTAGTCLSFLTIDEDVIDQAMRAEDAYSDQANQLSMAVSQSILRQ